MDDYTEPTWAKPPQQDSWKLVEIKKGTEIAEHKLEKACLMLGRAIDLVDVELAHESCSRRHARIAFDSRGVPWLRDLASTHGTIVNKKQLPPEAIGKLESMSKEKGSRGVVLFPGDSLQFGCSTRILLLEGPMEFERGAKPPPRQQQIEPLQSRETKERMEDIEYERKGVLDENSIPPQHKKIWESLKAKKYKYGNIETENERILAKGELTTGQERQVESNNKKVLQLKDEILRIEQDLRHKIFPGEEMKYQSLFSAANEEEDVEDRTRSRHTMSESPETEESLVLKWKSYQKQWMQQNGAIKSAEDRLEMIRTNMTLVKDEEDRFYLQNDFNLAKDTRDKISQRQSELINAIKDTEKLLGIVNKKIITNLETGYIGSEHSHPQNLATDLSLAQESSKSKFSNPQPKRKLPPVPSFKAPFVKKNDDKDKIAKSELKRRRVLGPSLAPASANDSSITTFQKNNSTTLTQMFGAQKDMWQRPDGQDGSGRSKLNDKFEGKY
mmetsp:Transcript_6025/g.8786  ORF Transcript_6025/g.8786 Transcript_6025/m.8786 type:complete len:500 (+) Transcript_6025:135-1634(+)